jgi:hypothetical protein
MKKEYILRDTIGNIQKANKHLIKPDKQLYYNSSHNYLYDFLLLEEHIKDIAILEEIKMQCMKNTSIINHETYISSQDDIYMSFQCYNGMIYFKPYKVYSESKNKYICIIMDCVYIEYSYAERSRLYNEFTVIEKISEHTHTDHAIEEYTID